MGDHITIPAADAPTAVPPHLEVMRSWLGTKEVPGPKANPTIAGKPWSWFSLVGYASIKSDEIANCAAAVGASIVAAELRRIGIALEDLTADGPTALDLIAEGGAPLALPPLNDRLLARSYCNFGIDTKADPAPGDIMVIPRGAAWQGHVMLLNEDLGGGWWDCIGANQSDTTSPARHHVGEALAIRRYVPATVNDLRAAGSTEIQAGDLLQNVGTAAAIGTPAVTGAAKVVDAVTAPPPETVEAVQTAARKAVDGFTLFNAVGDAAGTAGSLFVAHPWLIGCMILGVVVFAVGYELKRRRVTKAKQGVPLSSQIEAETASVPLAQAA